MTVRWKPLLILSGLFLVTAAVGVMAIAYTMMSAPGSDDLLALARKDRQARKYDNAVVHYRRALQQDAKNPAIHMELATLYAEWSGQAPAERRPDLRAQQLRSLADAAKYDPRRAEPRRLLLADALAHDEPAEAAQRAEELLKLEPADRDAHYVMAVHDLGQAQPDLEGARKHLEALEGEAPPRLRTEWARARAAEVARDEAALAAILARTTQGQPAPPAEAGAVDRLAYLRLQALAAVRESRPAALAGRAEQIRVAAAALVEPKDAPSNRITAVGVLLDDVRATLEKAATGAGLADKAKLDAAIAAIDQTIDATFKAATDPGRPVDLRIARAYASHLMARRRLPECLAVVDAALKAPVAALPAYQLDAMDLREVAVKATLAAVDDPARFDKAAPYIKDLLDSPLAPYQGLGHLFQGAIELERSGLVGGTGASTTDPKRKGEALTHLRKAAEQLPNVATAKALYGVALILSNEPALGRQYLQEARRLGGNLEPRYQIWAAWSMSEAGYPEDAEPIVQGLADRFAGGQLPRELEGTICLLAGEVAQARGGKENLARAEDQYRRAYASGQAVPSAVALRLAQLEFLRGDADAALTRLANLRAKARAGGSPKAPTGASAPDAASPRDAGPSVDRLTVMILLDQFSRLERGGKGDGDVEALMKKAKLDPADDAGRARLAAAKHAEARAVLEGSLKTYPADAEIAGLDATLLVREGKVKDAVDHLGAFLARNPESLPALELRAQILAEKVPGGGAEARRMLAQAAERSDNTGPLVQLAMLDLRDNDLDAAARTSAKIRARWKEAAAADLLDAQIAARREDPRGTVAALDAALKKDPGNKIAQFWKAQLDDRAGATGAATKVYQEIARQNPVREIGDGLSLATASRWALATQAFENQDLDGAIAGYQALLHDGEAGSLARAARWKLVAAHATKGRWEVARKELDALMKDPAASDEERVQAANYYRLNHEEPAAVALLDGVLKAHPDDAGAVVTRAYMLIGAEKPAEAVALIEKALAAAKGPAKPAVYLMLAAVENQRDGSAAGLRKAEAALDRGLAAHPGALDLIQAKARIMRLAGDGPGSIAFLEAQAKADPKGPVRRYLVDAYREAGDLARAEAAATELAQAAPKDPAPAVLVARLVGARAAAAAGKGDQAGEKALNERQATLIRQGRAAFPAEPAFLEAECDLAARRGDMARAMAVTKDLDALDGTSAAGPILRARLFEAQGSFRQAAEAYGDAVTRNPRGGETRLALGRAALAAGKPDEAVRQANWVLEGTPDAAAALLLKARGLAAAEGSDAGRRKNREEAVTLLKKAVAQQPKFAEAHRQLADVLLSLGRRPAALEALRAAVKAVPDDPATLSLLIQRMAESPAAGQPADPAALAEAGSLAQAAAAQDQRGDLGLAAAVGFHRAGQIALALPLAEASGAKIRAPGARLAYGDLLLAAAEGQAPSDPDRARALFGKAVAQYDQILAVQPTSVEAVNNKAWILHRYLKDDPAALALADGLVRRVDPASLPGEFFDTLGEIQESLGHAREAEEAYSKGLRKSPDLPILNYHMGRLVASDRARSGDAADYLQKARKGADRLRPADRDEIAGLLSKIGH